MLPGRLCWVPLLLALGVGSGSGGGGGGSRRRRLLAAKGGCWGSFLPPEEGPGGRAGAGAGAGAGASRAPGLTPRVHAPPCRSCPGLGALGIPEVSALRPGPRGCTCRRQPNPGRGRGTGEKGRAAGSGQLWGCLWRGVGATRAAARGPLEQGAGAGWGEAVVGSCPDRGGIRGRSRARPQPGGGWKLAGSGEAPPLARLGSPGDASPPAANPTALGHLRAEAPTWRPPGAHLAPLPRPPGAVHGPISPLLPPRAKAGPGERPALQGDGRLASGGL
ncbi:hypothetical protein VULLAG_LOCUS16535 [Vulpes lagopus]